jgi:hypothetical protein
VRDAETKAPISNATVFHDGSTVSSDVRGVFVLKRLNKSKPILGRAAGYRRGWAKASDTGGIQLELTPLEVRGVYLSYTALGSAEVRARVLGWVDGRRLNTLVVDIKDEHGRMSFYNGAPEAGRMGAFGAVRFDDIQAFIRDLHRKDVYVVGRISVFQDAVLAKHKPHWRPRSKGRGHLFWLDPFRKEVWAYNLAVAREAAAVGFDEIQFDQVRFPGDAELPQARYSRRDTARSRTKAVTGFLDRAREELLPFNVAVAAGPSTFSPGESQPDEARETWQRLGQLVDYVAVRVFSSAGLEAALKRLADEPSKLRVWLTYPGGPKTIGFPASLENIKELALASEAARTGGWVLSDPHDQYDDSAGVMREF